MGITVSSERPDLSGAAAGMARSFPRLDVERGPIEREPVERGLAERGSGNDTAPTRNHLAHPHPRPCGALPFLIQRDGTWLYRGSPIRRKPLVCLFASVLKRDDAGVYWLETPTERGSIEVEDVPFVAVELDWRGNGRDQVLAFRTNVDQIICAGPEHPLLVDWRRPSIADMGGAAPYLHVRGEGRQAIQARVSRAVYYELAALAVKGHSEGEDCLGVWSQAMFFPIGPLLPDEE